METAFFTLSHLSPMYSSLIHELAKNGHDVTVITPVYGMKSKFVKENGVEVLYFKSMPMLNIGLIRKGIANILFPYFCIRAVKKHLSKKKFGLILMTTPPLGFFQPIKYLKRRNNKSIVYLILRDIHPEGAKFVGLDRIKPMYNYFKKIEMELYGISDFIGCMSPRNISFVEENNPGIETKKLRMLPNWEEKKIYTEPNIKIRSKYDLEEKFIVVYGGNMGVPQNLSVMLELAYKKKDLDNVVFLLIGNGTEKAELEYKSKSMGLKNVRFMNSIPREDYDDLMKICDVGFISLHPKLPIPNIPSKTLGYFGAKLPILAVTDSITDYGEYILERSHSGLWSREEDCEKLYENFDILYNDFDLRKQMGENGYKFFIDNFTTDKAYEEIRNACSEYGN